MKHITYTGIVSILLSSLVVAQVPKKRQSLNQSRSTARGLSRLVAGGGAALLKSDFDPALLPSPLAKWLAAHRPAILGASATPFHQRTKWGVATVRNDRLFLHVILWPDNGKLLVPRLHNSVESIRLLGQDEALQLKPNVSDWEITLPAKPKLRDALLPVIEVKLDGPARAAESTPPVVGADENGKLDLHARYSIVHGEMLRFEPQPHKNTIGYWVKENDWAEWRCQPAQGGDYEVELRYGCGNGQGGSQVDIHVGEHVLQFTVQATGGFQAWRDVKLGRVTLSPDGPTRVAVKPKKKAKNAVMDIQQISLVPAK